MWHIVTVSILATLNYFSNKLFKNTIRINAKDIYFVKTTYNNINNQ